MSILTRIACFAYLSVALAHFAQPERVSSAAGIADPVAEVVQVHAVPHPASCGASDWLQDRRVPVVAGVPFAPAPAARGGILSARTPAPEPTWPGAGLNPDTLLPPSRAPPALS